MIFPPPQRKHAKEFRDRTFLSPFFMLCKMRTSIKIPESSVPAFSNQGEKSCILAVKTPAFNGNKILATDDGKTICKSSYLACPTKIQSKSAADRPERGPTDRHCNDEHRVIPGDSSGTDRGSSRPSGMLQQVKVLGFIRCYLLPTFRKSPAETHSARPRKIRQRRGIFQTL